MPLFSQAHLPNTSTDEAIPLQIRGIAIVDPASLISGLPQDTLSGVYIDEAIHVPGSFNDFSNFLEPFLDQPLCKETLLRIREAVFRYFGAHRQNLVMVEIPEQEVSSGVVSLVITPATVEDVYYTGNDWYSQENVARQIAICPGDPLDQDVLLNRISWLNENPFHYTEAVLSPGQAKGATRVEIITKDRFPVRTYAGANNAGLESTGTSRFFVGMTFAKNFDLLTYQFSSNSDAHRFYSHSFNSVSYLPWEHMITLQGGYAKIHPQFPDFRSDGTEVQASVRYKIPFKPLYTPFQQRLILGFDYKYVTSNLFFVGELNLAPVSEAMRQVNVAELVAGYLLEYTPPNHRLTFEAELCVSPFGWLPHQNNQSYSETRAGAKPYYLYTILSLGDLYTLPSKEALSALLRIQGASGELIPSEQFGLGGYNTIRGYEQCVFIADNAVCANFELRSRPARLWRKVQDELTLLAFVDYGWGYNYRAFDGMKTMASLLGVGPGLRYNIPPYVNLRVDFGFKLGSVDFDDGHLGMWHVGTTIGY